MAKKLEAITIYGVLVGTAWQGFEGMKEAVEVFTPEKTRFTYKWTGLEDALSIITKDGDFQYCVLKNAVINVRWSDGDYILTRAFDIPDCKLTHRFLAEA